MLAHLIHSKGLGASLLFVCRLAWILILARDCGEQENHASNGGRTWDALLTVLMASVSLLGQAKGSGRLHAPLGRMPTVRICILGALRRMYAKMWRILGNAQQPVRRDWRCDEAAEGLLE